MSKAMNLLNTDLEVLFTQYSIDEVEKLSQGLKHDIDHKREELRTMVGERYRDLMNAADTISQMRDSSESVISSLNLIIDRTNELQSASLMKTGFELRQDANFEDDDDNEEDLDDKMVKLAAQIKLLMDSPEKMWSAVEQSDFLLATQLYLFARHVHTSLTMNDSDGSLNYNFPVIERQWNAIAHFNESILEGCQSALASSTTPVKKSVESMAAIIFLRGITSKAMLQEFLELREESLKRFLRDAKSQSAKTYITHILTSIESFLATVHSAFISAQDNKCELDLLLDTVSCSPTLELFFSIGFASGSSPVMKHLTKIIKDFTPKVLVVKEEQSSQEISADFVKTSCTAWLDRIHDEVSEHTSSILEHVNTISALSKLRLGIRDSMKGDLVGLDWDKLCQETLSRKLVLWDEFYRNLFLDRVELLIESRIKENMQIIINDLNNMSCGAGSDDMFKYIWSEAGLSDFSTNKNSNEINSLLAMKTKVYTPSVQATCKNFNDSLTKLMEEITEYVKIKTEKDHNPMSFLLDNHSSGNDQSEAFSLTIDNDAILKFAQKTCMENFIETIKIISKQPTINNLEQGRLMLALAELCPAIVKCVDKLENLSKLDNNLTIPSSKSTPHWDQVKKILESEANQYFIAWIDHLIVSFKANLAGFLTNNSSLHVLTKWDTSEIAEEGESGEKVSSTIRVPQNISIGLHTALNELVKKVYSAGPHSLPGHVQNDLSQKTATAVVEAYISHSEAQKLIQNLALQLHFDLQFIMQSMISRDNNELSTLTSKAFASLERHIDPFDFSVFTPYITDNVKKCVLRNQTIFGAFIPTDRFSLLSTFKSTLPTSSNPDQQHNVIRMTSLNARFPLLPMSSTTNSNQQRRGRLREVPTNASSGSSSSLHVETSSTQSVSGAQPANRKRSKSPAAKIATSFFGSMGSNWFGGK